MSVLVFCGKGSCSGPEQLFFFFLPTTLKQEPSYIHAPLNFQHSGFLNVFESERHVHTTGVLSTCAGENELTDDMPLEPYLPLLSTDSDFITGNEDVSLCKITMNKEAIP